MIIVVMYISVSVVGDFLIVVGVIGIIFVVAVVAVVVCVVVVVVCVVVVGNVAVFINVCDTSRMYVRRWSCLCIFSGLMFVVIYQKGIGFSIPKIGPFFVPSFEVI